uniref:Uncharacterized protein n=1 Tax=Hemiselmis tepida TaxID=464990 RepID=A0A7S0W7D2_9CRYP|mmetsp:Transcript_38180/g.97598  ORF Transcript_38180/g.97598 Transcript_38180/m.97598 type:complete len:163 (+) Transcript_38180:137-625(+)
MPAATSTPVLAVLAACMLFGSSLGFPSFLTCDRNIKAGAKIMGHRVEQSDETIHLTLDGKEVPCGSDIIGDNSTVYRMNFTSDQAAVFDFNKGCGARFSKPGGKDCLFRSIDGNCSVTFRKSKRDRECMLRYTFAPGISGVRTGVACAYRLVATPSMVNEEL